MARPRSEWDPAVIEPIATAIVNNAFTVHREFGPGVYENIYKVALAKELRDLGHHVAWEVPLPVVYKGEDLGIGYRLDMVVDDLVVIEGKGVEKMIPKFKTQLLSYLRLGNYPLGFILNFHEEWLKDGIVRVANGYFPDRPPS